MAKWLKEKRFTYRRSIVTISHKLSKVLNNIDAHTENTADI